MTSDQLKRILWQRVLGPRDYTPTEITDHTLVMLESGSDRIVTIPLDQIVSCDPAHDHKYGAMVTCWTLQLA